MTAPDAAASAWTIARARREVARLLREAGFDTPDLDARLLVGHALALDHTQLTLQAESAVLASQWVAIECLAARRLAHEPVAHIVGEAEFWGLRLAVNADVLVPRADTETVVEAALAAMAARRGASKGPALIADLGVGSGALVLALLSEWPDARGLGIDRSWAALNVARCNAQRLGLTKRAAFVLGDFGAALAGGLDLIVSNPPYIASDEIAALDADVRDHEPRMALDGGVDGLSAYRVIAADAARLLSPGGCVVVELGAGQETQVAALMAEEGLHVEAPARRDLASIPRALTAWRRF